VIQNFSTNMFNESVAGSQYFWNADIIVTCLVIITMCQILLVIQRFGSWVLK
jgi:hypothetical protein